MPDPTSAPPDPVPPRVVPLKVAGFQGHDDELRLSLARVPGGNGVMAIAEADNEQTLDVFMGELNLMGSDGKGGIQTAASGMGMVGLSDQRAFGLLMTGQGLGHACQTDRRGNGLVVLYSVGRPLFEKHKAIQGGGLRKKTKAVSLIGNFCALTLEVIGRQGPDGRFAKATSDDLLAAVQGWVGA